MTALPPERAECVGPADVLAIRSVIAATVEGGACTTTLRADEREIGDVRCLVFAPAPPA